MQKLLKEIHPSWMTSFKKCPYKYKYDKSEVRIENTFHGSLLDMAWASDWDMSPHISYYINNMPTLPRDWAKEVSKIKLSKYLSNGISNIRQFLENVRGKWYKLYMQPKMFMTWGEYIIVWTPDVYYKKEDEDLYICLDCKWSTRAMYEKEDTFDSMQPVVYSRFIMSRHNVSKVRFAFFVVCKYSWDISLQQKEYTLEECDKIINEYLEEYSYAEVFDEYPAKECGMCGFCPLRRNNECPIYQKKNLVFI